MWNAKVNIFKVIFRPNKTFTKDNSYQISSGINYTNNNSNFKPIISDANNYFSSVNSIKDNNDFNLLKNNMNNSNNIKKVTFKDSS